MKRVHDPGIPGPSKRAHSSASGSVGPNLKKFLKMTEEHRATLNSKSGRTALQEEANQQPTAGGSLVLELNRGDADSANENIDFPQNGSFSIDDAGMPAQELVELREERQVAANNLQTIAGNNENDSSQLGQGNLPAGTNELCRLEELEEFEENPSDVLAAIQLLHSQFPKVRKKVDIPPIILKSQVYSIVKNRTEVDRELEVLKHRHTIRVFKLVTVGEEYALTLAQDYAAQVRLAQEQSAAKGSLEHALVFDWFLESVVPNHVDAGITDAHLRRLLSGPGRPAVRECHVSLLLQSGLLVRQLADTTAFWFAIPNVGLVIKSLVQGRKELVSFLSRRKYQEMLQSELSRRNLRYSILGMQFHLRDLLGSGRATVHSTTVGPLIRLSRT